MPGAALFLGAGLTLLSAVVDASPQIYERAAQCNRDNLLRCFVDTRSASQASAFCSALEPSTTTVATVIATSTAVATDTVTYTTITETILLSETVFTATTPSQTVTVTRDAAQITQPAKRQVNDPPAPPKCGLNSPASRITSACSCIEVPAKTISVTFTAGTATVTDRQTTSVAATVSTTIYTTINTHVVSGISTLTVDPPSPTNLVVNGGFEDGLNNYNFYNGGDASVIETIQPGQNSGNAMRILVVDGSEVSFQQELFFQTQKTYQLGFSAKNVDISTIWMATQSHIDLTLTASEPDADGWVQYSGSYILSPPSAYFTVLMPAAGEYIFDNVFLMG